MPMMGRELLASMTIGDFALDEAAGSPASSRAKSPIVMDANSSRPIIGITCYVEEAVRGVRENMPHALLPLSLIHISEPTRRTPISYAVFCLKKKKTKNI